MACILYVVEFIFNNVNRTQLLNTNLVVPIKFQKKLIRIYFDKINKISDFEELELQIEKN